MGFWIFMLVMCMLMPTVLIIFGKLFIKSAPKEINFLFGYRTTMSMKNRDTWEFAHKYIGKLWFVSGIFLLPISIIAMLFTLGSSENVIGTVSIILCYIDLFIIIGTIIPTEIALNKQFDKNGKRK